MININKKIPFTVKQITHTTTNSTFEKSYLNFIKNFESILNSEDNTYKNILLEELYELLNATDIITFKEKIKSIEQITKQNNILPILKNLSKQNIQEIKSAILKTSVAEAIKSFEPNTTTKKTIEHTINKNILNINKRLNKEFISQTHNIFKTIEKTEKTITVSANNLYKINNNNLNFFNKSIKETNTDIKNNIKQIDDANDKIKKLKDKANSASLFSFSKLNAVNVFKNIFNLSKFLGFTAFKGISLSAALAKSLMGQVLKGSKFAVGFLGKSILSVISLSFSVAFKALSLSGKLLKGIIKWCMSKPGIYVTAFIGGYIYGRFKADIDKGITNLLDYIKNNTFSDITADISNKINELMGEKILSAEKDLTKLNTTIKDFYSNLTTSYNDLLATVVAYSDPIVLRASSDYMIGSVVNKGASAGLEALTLNGVDFSGPMATIESLLKVGSSVGAYKVAQAHTKAKTLSLLQNYHELINESAKKELEIESGHKSIAILTGGRSQAESMKNSVKNKSTHTSSLTTVASTLYAFTSNVKRQESFTSFSQAGVEDIINKMSLIPLMYVYFVNYGNYAIPVVYSALSSAKGENKNNLMHIERACRDLRITPIDCLTYMPDKSVDDRNKRLLVESDIDLNTKACHNTNKNDNTAKRILAEEIIIYQTITSDYCQNISDITAANAEEIVNSIIHDQRLITVQQKLTTFKQDSAMCIYVRDLTKLKSEKTVSEVESYSNLGQKATNILENSLMTANQSIKDEGSLAINGQTFTLTSEHYNIPILASTVGESFYVPAITDKEFDTDTTGVNDISDNKKEIIKKLQKLIYILENISLRLNLYLEIIKNNLHNTLRTSDSSTSHLTQANIKLDYHYLCILLAYQTTVSIKTFCKNIDDNVLNNIKTSLGLTLKENFSKMTDIAKTVYTDNNAGHYWNLNKPIPYYDIYEKHVKKGILNSENYADRNTSTFETIGKTIIAVKNKLISYYKIIIEHIINEKNFNKPGDSADNIYINFNNYIIVLEQHIIDLKFYSQAIYNEAKNGVSHSSIDKSIDTHRSTQETLNLINSFLNKIKKALGIDIILDHRIVNNKTFHIYLNGDYIHMLMATYGRSVNITDLNIALPPKNMLHSTTAIASSVYSIIYNNNETQNYSNISKTNIQEVLDTLYTTINKIMLEEVCVDPNVNVEFYIGYKSVKATDNFKASDKQVVTVGHTSDTQPEIATQYINNKNNKTLLKYTTNNNNNISNFRGSQNNESTYNEFKQSQLYTDQYIQYIFFIIFKTDLAPIFTDKDFLLAFLKINNKNPINIGTRKIQQNSNECSLIRCMLFYFLFSQNIINTNSGEVDRKFLNWESLGTDDKTLIYNRDDIVNILRLAETIQPYNANRIKDHLLGTFNDRSYNTNYSNINESINYNVSLIDRLRDTHNKIYKGKRDSDGIKEAYLKSIKDNTNIDALINTYGYAIVAPHVYHRSLGSIFNKDTPAEINNLFIDIIRKNIIGAKDKDPNSTSYNYFINALLNNMPVTGLIELLGHSKKDANSGNDTKQIGQTLLAAHSLFRFFSSMRNAITSNEKENSGKSIVSFFKNYINDNPISTKLLTSAAPYIYGIMANDKWSNAKTGTYGIINNLFNALYNSDSNTTSFDIVNTIKNNTESLASGINGEDFETNPDDNKVLISLIDSICTNLSEAITKQLNTVCSTNEITLHTINNMSQKTHIGTLALAENIEIPTYNVFNKLLHAFEMSNAENLRPETLLSLYLPEYTFDTFNDNNKKSNVLNANKDVFDAVIQSSEIQNNGLGLEPGSLDFILNEFKTTQIVADTLKPTDKELEHGDQGNSLLISVLQSIGIATINEEYSE